MNIGVISDTHGLLRPEAIAALADSDLILHAGDIGKPEVLEKLRTIAPVTAIRGNVDNGSWAENIPDQERITLEAVSIYLLHSAKDLDFDPKTTGIRAVISGHSHKAMIEERDGVLFINPGSAGPRRFKLPISIAKLHIVNASIEAQIIELAIKVV